LILNAIVPTAPPQSSGFALVPRDMREAMTSPGRDDGQGQASPGRPAAEPGRLPAGDRASDALEHVSPFAVAQEVSLIQGKPMHSGKIVAAAVQQWRARGPLSYEYSGEGAGRSVTVRGRLRGETEPRRGHGEAARRQDQNQWWTKSPDQMLSYHGARVWARRTCRKSCSASTARRSLTSRAPPRPSRGRCRTWRSRRSSRKPSRGRWAAADRAADWKGARGGGREVAAGDQPCPWPA
jgi:hypothetical protein